MKILDTNLWVFGTLRTNEQAAELLAEIDRGETTSADSKWAKQLLAELADGLEADAVDGYLAVRLKVAEQGVDFVFEPILRRLLSEVRLIDVNVAEQEETVRAVAAAIIDQERVTAELRP